MQTTTKQKRFFEILNNALQIGLETTVLKSDLEKTLQNGAQLPEGFSVRDPNARRDKPDAKTVSLIHPAASNGFSLKNDLINPLSSESVLEIVFSKIPDGATTLFQRLNLKQIRDFEILGLICGRFGETKPFIIKNRNEDPQNPVGHINLDCFSKTKVWNPLFLKYHLNTPLKNVEWGYLKMDARIEESRDILITISRVLEEKAPLFLKDALTFPR